MARRSPVFARRLVIFAKAPRLGAVKSRLARDIGAVAATAWYRKTATDLVRRLARDRRWRTYVAVTPDAAVQAAAWRQVFGAAVPRIAQGSGDLGDRMGRVFARMPPGPVVIVGTDCPDLSCDDIAAAFDALGPHDAVFGPAADGGYWLIGLRRVPRAPIPFADVRWSTAHALDDTLRNLDDHAVALLPVRVDIDTGDDWQRWRNSRRDAPSAAA